MRTIDSLDELDAALAGSARAPILLFKQSLTCGTSAVAMEEMQDLAEAPDLSAQVYVIRVQRAREVSDAISARFGIRHESPQVLLVADNRVEWHASHFNVTADNVRSALRRLSHESVR